MLDRGEIEDRQSDGRTCGKEKRKAGEKHTKEL